MSDYTSDSTQPVNQFTREQWDEIGRQLREPFDPREVDFRAQGRASEQTGKAQVVAYIDARAVQDRLDAVVGVGGWSFGWEPLVIEKGEVMVAKGTLTIHGVAKADAGSASNFEQSLGAVSHCFKRAAVHWGIGRYLYGLPMSWVAVEKNGRIPDATLRELRSRLPRPSAHAATSATTTFATVASQPEAAAASMASATANAPAAMRPTATLEYPEATQTARPAAEGATSDRRAATPRPTRGAARPAAPSVAPQTAASGAPLAAPQAAPNSGSLGSATALPGGVATATQEPYATEQQLVSIRKLCAALSKPEPEPGVTYAQARQIITQLSGEYQRIRRAS